MSKIIQLKDSSGKIYPKTITNIITVSLSQNTSVNQNAKIPLDKKDSQVGSNLSFTNNGIVIGDNISYVKITGMLSVQYSASNTIYSAQIKINGNEILPLRTWTYKNSTHVKSATFTNYLVKVKKGDIIELYLYDNKAVIRPETSITVEQVL